MHVGKSLCNCNRVFFFFLNNCKKSSTLSYGRPKIIKIFKRMNLMGAPDSVTFLALGLKGLAPPFSKVFNMEEPLK